MAESRSLRMALSLRDAHEFLMSWLSRRLVERGHQSVSPSALGFLGQLDCDINYAAEVARRLGVSRQMAGRRIAEMEKQGWIEVSPNTERRNRKSIRFTERGERLMSDARSLLSGLDDTLDEYFGPEWIESLTEHLRRLPEAFGEEPG